MKIAVKGGEHVRIKHDSAGLGFQIHVDADEIHIRAKSPDEPDKRKTTLIAESKVELSK